MVELRIREGIAGIFLNRPEKSNALNSALLEELLAKLKAIEASPGLRVVVLAGNGKSFCGGADIAEMAELKAPSAKKFITRIHRCCEAIRHLRVPVVARLHGAVVGAGLEIAASCDLRIAEEGTAFAMPEVLLGIPSVVEAALLPRLIGAGRAAWLVMTGEPIGAKTALEWGLVQELAPLATLDERVGALLERLVAADPAALAAQKALLRLWQEAPLDEALAASIGIFAAAYGSDAPNKRMRATISRGRGSKEH
ncbi:MAG TPA: enoyl-CoA hydratase-related protein [Burkholderiales bacterium]|jgi:enoyl-CoA hydratase/carnithine racemase